MENTTKDSVTVFRHELVVENAVYSSLIGIMKNFFYGLFPKDFFKYTYIGNSIASVTELGRSDDEKMSKPTPSLALKISYEAQQDGSTDGNSYLNGYLGIPKNAFNHRMYNGLIRDYKTNTFLSGMPTRQKNNFEVIISLKEEMQAVNVLGSLRRRFPVNNYFVLNRQFISVPVPMGLIGYIAKVKGFDMKNPGQMEKFVEYIKEISGGRVMWKNHLSTSKPLFFFNYEANILIKMSSIDNPEGNKENKSVINTDVRLQVEVEFPTYDYLVTEIFNFQGNRSDIDGVSIYDDGGSLISLHFSVPTIPRELPNRFKSVWYVEFVTEANTDITEIEFEEYLNPYLKNIFKFSKLNGVDITPNLQLVLYEDGKPLPESDYELDWEKFKVTMLKPKMNFDYKMCVYGNLIELDKYNNVPLEKGHVDNNHIEENV
ncbi:hypothetical protein [Proteus mirabilis]|uniref:hypothetical protein n=1 Tax=Proteus mirabilis TaxID=584 RepID=UPI0034D5638E